MCADLDKGSRYNELKEHKPQFDEKCLRYLYNRKQTKMMWLPDPNHGNADKINNVKREVK